MNDSENSLEVADCSSEPISTFNEFQETPRKVPESIEQALASVEQALENVREALGTNGKNEDNGVHENGQQEDNFEEILSKAVDETIPNGHAELEEEIKAPKQRRRKLKKIILADGSVEEISCDESDEESGGLPQQYVEVIVPEQNLSTEPVEEVKEEAEASNNDFEQSVGESEVQNEIEKVEEIKEIGSSLAEDVVETINLVAGDEPDAKIEEDHIQNATEAIQEKDHGISEENGNETATMITENSEEPDAFAAEKDLQPEASYQIPVEEKEVEPAAEDTEIAVADSDTTGCTLETENGLETQENTECAKEKSVTEENILEPESYPEEALQTTEEIKAEVTFEAPDIPEVGVESRDSDLEKDLSLETIESTENVGGESIAIEEENEVKESDEIKGNVEPKLEMNENIESVIEPLENKKIEVPEVNEHQSNEDENKAEPEGSTIESVSIPETIQSPGEEALIEGRDLETSTNIDEVVEIPEKDADEKPIDVENKVADEGVLVVKSEDLVPTAQEEAINIPEANKVEPPIEDSIIAEIGMESTGCTLKNDLSLETTVNTGEEPFEIEKDPEHANINLTVKEEDEVKETGELEIQAEPISTESEIPVESEEIKIKVEPINSDSEIVVEPSTTSLQTTNDNDNKSSADEVQKDSDKLTLLVSGIIASAIEDEDNKIAVNPEIESEIQSEIKQNEDAPRHFNVGKQPDSETANLETDMVVALQETIADLEKEEDGGQKPLAEKKVEETEPQVVQKSETEKKVSDSPPKSIREQYKAANAPKPEASKSSCILS